MQCSRTKQLFKKQIIFADYFVVRRDALLEVANRPSAFGCARTEAEVSYHFFATRILRFSLAEVSLAEHESHTWKVYTVIYSI